MRYLKRIILFTLLISYVILTGFQNRQINWKYYEIGMKKYGYLIKTESYNTKLPESLIEAVICAETAQWNETAHNRKSNCIGLMGIKSNGTKEDITKLKNPSNNIRLGSKILLHKIKTHGGWFKGLTRYGNSKKYAKMVLRFYNDIEKYKKENSYLNGK